MQTALELKVSPAIVSRLSCPQTRRPLEIRERSSLGIIKPIERTGFTAPRFELNRLVASTADGEIGYPIVDGFPALLWPEAHTGTGSEKVDLNNRNYAEAYAEMEHYNPTAAARARDIERSDAYATVHSILRAKSAPELFPVPQHLWLDALHDTAAQNDCYSFLAPLLGKVFVQLGGDGRHAVKSVLAGAKEGILITPMIGEAEFAWRLAEVAGVQDRFSCILGIGEQIPLLSDTIDAMYSPGCLHHMALDTALPEIHRALTPGGRFCGHEPWRAPLYALGTKLFGKREHGLFERSKSIFCQPFTTERLKPLSHVFPNHAIRNHGPLFRYPMIAFQKFGVRLPLSAMIRVGNMDDKLGKWLGLKQSWGGSVMIGGQKTDS
jgi:uncharacterized protein YbaR (Trm112 family)